MLRARRFAVTRPGCTDLEIPACSDAPTSCSVTAVATSTTVSTDESGITTTPITMVPAGSTDTGMTTPASTIGPDLTTTTTPAPATTTTGPDATTSTTGPGVCDLGGPDGFSAGDGNPLHRECGYNYSCGKTDADRFVDADGDDAAQDRIAASISPGDDIRTGRAGGGIIPVAGHETTTGEGGNHGKGGGGPGRLGSSGSDDSGHGGVGENDGTGGSASGPSACPARTGVVRLDTMHRGTAGAPGFGAASGINPDDNPTPDSAKIH